MIRPIFVLAIILGVVGISPITSAEEYAGSEKDYYVRLGILTSLYRDSSFRDGDCDSRAQEPLFGCGRDSSGRKRQAFVEFDWDSNIGAQIGLGTHVTPWLRVEGNFDYQFDRNISGNSNFPYVLEENQKFSSDLEIAALTFWGIVDSPSVPLLFERDFNIYAGIGFGIGHLSLKDTRIDYPITYTAIPNGATFNPVFGITAGLSHEITEKVTFDLGWRYMDYGKIRSGSGGGAVRWHDGSRTLPLNLSPIEASLRGSEFLASLRYHF